MNIKIVGKNIELGKSFQAYSSGRIDEVLKKYSYDAVSAQITLEKRFGNFKAKVKIYLKNKIEQGLINKPIPILKNINVGIYLAVIYTIGHILIAMTCNRLLTGAPLNLAVIDAFIEPIVNGFWFYLLFEVFNKYKQKYRLSAAG